MIWQEMTPLELVRKHRPVAEVGAMFARARRAALALLSSLVLTGCAGARFDQCREAAGPKPEANSEILLGPLGALVTMADPERRAWNHRVHECMTADPKPIASTAP
jgi:hypothetical protein